MTLSPFTSAVSPNGVNSKNVTKDDILRTLESIRANREQRQGYMAPRDYKEFMPASLGYNPPDTSPYMATLQSIGSVGDKATAVSLAIAQNKAAAQQVNKAKKQQKLQQKQLLAQQQQTFPTVGGVKGSTPGPVKGFNVKAPIKTYQWRGYSLTLNSSVANRFIGFLDALSARGYKIKSIGTYANRNIAGTTVKSLHSLGLAMDINPSNNPVTYNGHNITNLPPQVGALAAKYGLKWGGAWLHSKRDPMHFSVPYGGRE